MGKPEPNQACANERTLARLMLLYRMRYCFSSGSVCCDLTSDRNRLSCSSSDSVTEGKREGANDVQHLDPDPPRTWIRYAVWLLLPDGLSRAGGEGVMNLGQA